MTGRRGLQDQVAIIGVGVSPYSRSFSERSLLEITLEACVDAIRDSGTSRDEIDGICGSSVAAHLVQYALGIPEATWFANFPSPFSNQLTAGVNAVHSGICETLLIYNSHMLTPGRSRAAEADPYRIRQDLGVGDIRSWRGAGHVEPEPKSLFGIAAYAAWMNRYMDEFGARREDFGLISISDRTNAGTNPNAVMKKPLEMSEYLNGRMVREPMCVYDMDLPVDGADAFIVTTAERAQDLTDRPVLVHAQAMGQDVLGDEDQNVSFDRTGQSIAAKALWRASNLKLSDIDVFYPYDGFTIIAMNWFENVGYCGRGEGADFVRSHWDQNLKKILIDGRIAVNPHGGSLSEGATSGSGHIRAAVRPLSCDLTDRDVPAAQAALVTIGGLFFNPAAYVLRRG